MINRLLKSPLQLCLNSSLSFFLFQRELVIGVKWVFVSHFAPGHVYVVFHVQAVAVGPEMVEKECT